MRIAINGCGIAGPTLAWWLRRSGHEPILFERAPAPRDGGYVIDFWGTGFDVAEAMGLLPALRDDAYPIEHLRTVTATGRTTANLGVGVFDTLTGGRFLSLRRSDLARHIFHACDGIATRFSCAVTGFEDRGDRVHLALSDGTTQDADMLIGADGLHSAVRGLVFGHGFETPLGYHVAAVTLDGFAPRTERVYVIQSRPGRSLSRVALRGDKTLVLMVFSDHLAGPAPITDATVHDTLRRVYADMGPVAEAALARIDAAPDFYFDRVSQVRMPDWSRGRVALLGDAGACASLLAGEGCGLAMTSAFVLSAELDRAGGDAGRADYRAAFRAWHDRLGEYVQAKQTGALGFAGFFAPKSQLSLVLRDAALTLARLPGLGPWLLSRGLVDDIDLGAYGMRGGG